LKFTSFELGGGCRNLAERPLEFLKSSHICP
jgi:hypothetical protein